MTMRFTNALFISEGACNPSGIALAIHEACKECIKDNIQQRTDPAVRLMAYQLAYLLNLRELDEELDSYGKLLDECRKKSNQEVKIKKVKANV